MIQSISKLVLVAAVAALAVTVTSSQSMARGKKAAACAPVWSAKTHTCTNGVCTMLRCHADGKWYPSMVMCWQPWCPK